MNFVFSQQGKLAELIDNYTEMTVDAIDDFPLKEALYLATKEE